VIANGQNDQLVQFRASCFTQPDHLDPPVVEGAAPFDQTPLDQQVQQLN
jgi:hypothetical protein